MHDFTMPPEAIAAVTARLGRPHAVEALEPTRTALLVVDMQNYFVAPGEPFETPVARAVVPNVNALAGGVRRAGGTVAWILNEAPRTAAEAWPSYRELHTPERWAVRERALAEGTRSHALWDALAAEPDDLHVPKTRFSAFIPGASDLDARLRARGVDTLLVAGVATNICCESTARDAMMLNYRVVMLADACAAPDDGAHAASLINFYRFFGDVHDTPSILAMLRAADAEDAVA